MFLPSILHSTIWYYGGNYDGYYDGAILVISNLISVCPAMKVNCVFSKRVLPTSQDVQPSPVVIGCAALEASGASLTNTLQGSIPHKALRFFT